MIHSEKYSELCDAFLSLDDAEREEFIVNNACFVNDKSELIDAAGDEAMCDWLHFNAHRYGYCIDHEDDY